MFHAKLKAVVEALHKSLPTVIGSEMKVTRTPDGIGYLAYIQLLDDINAEVRQTMRHFAGSVVRENMRRHVLQSLRIDTENRLIIIKLYPKQVNRDKRTRIK